MEKENKKVDESWKEKTSLPPAPPIGADEQAKDNNLTGEDKTHKDFMPPANFTMLASSLGIQATISLGEVENPMTNKKETDLGQAKYLIDTLGMLQEKTKNNLSKDEADMLENILFQLRTLFLEKSNSSQINK